MSDHFNKLTPAEAELLALLAEECGEVVQIVGKILRHGFESCHPAGGPTNRQLLEEEIGHIDAAVSLLTDGGHLETCEISEHCHDKGDSVVKWLHHQEPSNV